MRIIPNKLPNSSEKILVEIRKIDLHWLKELFMNFEHDETFELKSGVLQRNKCPDGCCKCTFDMEGFVNDLEKGV